MSSELRSGDLLFSDMDGLVPGAFPVAIGQGLLFLSRRWWRTVRSPRTWWHWRHAAVIGWEGRTVIQAMPKGCEEVSFDEAKHWTPGHLYIRPNYGLGGAAWVASAARQYVGTPYGFATYVRLAAGALRFRLTEAWLRKRLSTRKDMICSQHVDQSLADAGYHVFDDGRLPQDVVPAELAMALLKLPGQFLIPNHPQFGQWTDNEKWSAK